jgi:hypothetical protein
MHGDGAKLELFLSPRALDLLWDAIRVVRQGER